MQNSANVGSPNSLLLNANLKNAVAAAGNRKDPNILAAVMAAAAAAANHQSPFASHLHAHQLQQSHQNAAARLYGGANLGAPGADFRK